ncbi:unknown protein [Seminavis robusta]|uniref:Uncharacterized protein n=1 Tax=Seminavis robusta TaxID=568900 RepID=A0A9N8F164_9STRA|nr:unknown protein [Seminavis robusta]|eukprot:Sro2240_g320270.1 n/a (617) ;mRNA; f:8220-10070
MSTREKAVVKLVEVDYSAESTKAKKKSAIRLVQRYLDTLQVDKNLRRINFVDLTVKGGGNSRKQNHQQWWDDFWKFQPTFWLEVKQANGQPYSAGTLNRYMGAVKDVLKQQLRVQETHAIFCAYREAKLQLGKAVRANSKHSTDSKGNKIYTEAQLDNILMRSLWMNNTEYLQFYILHVACLKMSSRVSETGRLPMTRCSMTDVVGLAGRKVRLPQIWSDRDKCGENGNIPLLPNREKALDDITVVLAISMLMFGGERLTPGLAGLALTNVHANKLSSWYTSHLAKLYKKYPPSNSCDVKQGTSHWLKHTAQHHLDTAGLSMAAKMWAGHKVDEGSRTNYFYTRFGYLLEGQKCLSGWYKLQGEFPDVVIPDFQDVGTPNCVATGDKLCSALFGHVDCVDYSFKRCILVCFLAKWDALLDLLQEGIQDVNEHILVSRVNVLLTQKNVSHEEFHAFKAGCCILPSYSPGSVKESSQRPKDAPESSSSKQFIAMQPKTGPTVQAFIGQLKTKVHPVEVLLKWLHHVLMGGSLIAVCVDNKTENKWRRTVKAIKVMLMFMQRWPEPRELTLTFLTPVHECLIQRFGSKFSLASLAKEKNKHNYPENIPILVKQFLINKN